MAELQVVKFKTLIDFRPLIEASNRMQAEFQRQMFTLDGQPYIVATGQDGATHVRKTGRKREGLYEAMVRVQRDIDRKLDDAIINGDGSYG